MDSKIILTISGIIFVAMAVYIIILKVDINSKDRDIANLNNTILEHKVAIEKTNAKIAKLQASEESLNKELKRARQDINKISIIKTPKIENISNPCTDFLKNILKAYYE